MRLNTFNICPTCIHSATCILTHQKNSVWSCSDYDEKANKVSIPEKSLETERQLEMAMA